MDTKPLQSVRNKGLVIWILRGEFDERLVAVIVFRGPAGHGSGLYLGVAPESII